MPRKKLKVSHEESLQCVDFCTKSSAKVISDLPDEMLRKIFYYLSPADLLAICNLRVQRITELTFTFRSANFSVCNTVASDAVQSFFINERANHIKEINFDNLFSVTPIILTECIKKCKNITKLSIYNCGIPTKCLKSILSTCKALEECYWSLMDPASFKDIPRQSHDNNSTINLKKLYLQLKFDTFNNYAIARLLDMSPSVEDICLNYTSSYITSIPSNLATRHWCLRCKLRNRDFVVNIIYPHHFQYFVGWRYDSYKKRAWFDFIELFKDAHLDVLCPLTCHTSYLQFVSKYMDKLPPLSSKNTKSMVAIITEENSELWNRLENIKNYTDRNLRHLSVTTKQVMLEQDSHETICGMNVLKDITANSSNISVLNLADLHVDYAIPFSHLCNLKNLKVLYLCSCCLCKGSIAEVVDIEADFKKFIESCDQVEEFGLFGCDVCRQGPMDKEMVPISKWSKLKSLTLDSVLSFKRCQFFLHIANNCSKLQRVELVSLGDKNVCHYISNLVTILKKSKELVFLRINQPAFYPAESLFWKAVETAQNLQGLCLATNIETFIEKKLILNSLEKLPHLNLFHLGTKRKNGLQKHIQRMMVRKGVKNPNLNVCNFNSTVEPFGLCRDPHFV